MPTLADEVDAMEALTAQDRCDRCGAQAYMRVVMPGDGSGVLLFCAHHARDHRDAVVEKGGVIAVDETHKVSTTTA